MSAKTVNIKKLADRDNDGKADAKYGVRFPQPAHGRYRFIATFAGDANTGARSTLLRFRV